MQDWMLNAQYGFNTDPQKFRAQFAKFATRQRTFPRVADKRKLLYKMDAITDFKKPDGSSDLAYAEQLKYQTRRLQRIKRKLTVNIKP